ncbi:MAG: hypothetical protein HC927_03795 [Deltaproteobacteria bacterium]|nr:hypothetical protein [Deltaproteobacteria bacterium]
MGLALVVVIYRAFDTSDAYGPSQQVVVVLLRYCGPVGLAMGAGGLLLAALRAKANQLAWVLLAAAIVLATALKQGIRYEFYYARYLVGDVIPVLIIAGAVVLGELSRAITRRFGPRRSTAFLIMTLSAWWLPQLHTLKRPVYWTRDLEHSPEDLAAIFAEVPDDALLFFDARAPHRWRDILATPALLSFDRNVLVYPSGRLVEGAITAGTPVYMLSGGWEPEDHQRWPDAGPWRTAVIARGHYRAERAEIVEGGMPERMSEWGGPWELHVIDRSIWRGTGAFSLYPGSRFIARDEPGRLESVPIELRWQAGARVELHVRPGALEGCTIAVALVGDENHELARASESSDRAYLFELPTVTQPLDAALALTWHCEEPRALRWRRLSLR